jgi:hypothetical protein
MPCARCQRLQKPHCLRHGKRLLRGSREAAANPRASGAYSRPPAVPSLDRGPIGQGARLCSGPAVDRIRQRVANSSSDHGYLGAASGRPFFISDNPKPQSGGYVRLGLWCWPASLTVGPSTYTNIPLGHAHVRPVVSPWLTSLSGSAPGYLPIAGMPVSSTPIAPVFSRRHRAVFRSGRRHDPHRDAGACEYAQHEDDHAYGHLRRPAWPFAIERRSHFVGSGTRHWVCLMNWAMSSTAARAVPA